MKLAVKDLCWAVHKGLEKVLPYVAAMFVIAATMLVVLMTVVGVIVTVYGDTKVTF